MPQPGSLVTCGSPPGQVKHIMNLYLEKSFQLLKGSDDRAISTLKRIVESSDEEIQLSFQTLRSSEKLQVIGVLGLYQHNFEEDGDVTSRLFTIDIDPEYGFNEAALQRHLYHFLRLIKRRKKGIWFRWVEPDGTEQKRYLRLQ